MSYVPKGRLANTYRPVPSVREVRVRPLPGFVAVTSTPGITPPDESVMLPLIVPWVWVWPKETLVRKNITLAKETRPKPRPLKLYLMMFPRLSGRLRPAAVARGLNFGAGCPMKPAPDQECERQAT